MSLPKQRVRDPAADTHDQDPATLVYQCCQQHCAEACPTRDTHKRPCGRCLSELMGNGSL
jgi:hypothetical protein